MWLHALYSIIWNIYEHLTVGKLQCSELSVHAVLEFGFSSSTFNQVKLMLWTHTLQYDNSRILPVLEVTVFDFPRISGITSNRKL